nr:myopalladin-like [Misgurnus anguillicaudatus]
MKAQKYMVECQQVGQNVWKKSSLANQLLQRWFRNCINLAWTPPEKDRVQTFGLPAGEMPERYKPVGDSEPIRPYFKDPVDFMIARAGNSIRIKVNYEGTPQPDITWLKNEEPVSSWVNIINVENMSTLVIPSSQYPDSGVYTIMAKNSSGHNSFDIEVRVQMNQSAHQALWTRSRWFMVK